MTNSKHLPFLLALLLCVGCAAQPAAAPIADAMTSPTPTLAVVTAEPVSTPTPTARPNLRLRFWLPDELAGLDDPDAGDVLAQQISAFRAAYPQIEIELRLRATEGTGGLLEALRAASAVAPGTLPDITLLRYDDFRAAVASSLLQPLDLRQLVVDAGDYHPAVAATGQIDDQWWGVPAAIEVLHVVYSDAQPPIASWRFDDLLAEETPLLFPAASVSGLSPVLLHQYVTAGGAAAVNGSGLRIDENALRAVLGFYERAADVGLITPAVLEYDAPSRYPDAIAGSVPVVVTSSMYMRAVSQGLTLNRGYLPTLTGQPSTVLDGWIWVITATSTDRQTAALRFLNWMVDTDRQSAYANAIHMLPALRAAQRQIDAEYATFVDSLLETALPENTGTLTARTLQNAFAAVINGQSTAADAVAAVLAQVGG